MDLKAQKGGLSAWQARDMSYKALVDTLTEGQLNWLAAAIDGEGHLAIRKIGDGYAPRLVIGNTSYEFVKKAAVMLGGKPWQPKRNVNHVNTEFRWEGNRVLKSLLPLIHKRLVVKRGQSLCIQYHYVEPENRRFYWELSRKLNKVGMDRLDEIFKRQAALQERLGNEYTQEFLTTSALAAIVEITEFLQETPWRPWKKGAPPANPTRVREELADIQHFFTNLCLATGVTAGELFVEYMRKNLKNHQRQDEGY